MAAWTCAPYSAYSGSVLVAYSGGVDSAYLAWAAHDVAGKSAACRDRGFALAPEGPNWTTRCASRTRPASRSRSSGRRSSRTRSTCATSRTAASTASRRCSTSSSHSQRGGRFRVRRARHRHRRSRRRSSGPGVGRSAAVRSSRCSTLGLSKADVRRFANEAGVARLGQAAGGVPFVPGFCTARA